MSTEESTRVESGFVSSPSVNSPLPSSLTSLQEFAQLIQSATNTKDVRRIVDVLTVTFRLRSDFTEPVIQNFLNKVLPDGSRLISFVSGEVNSAEVLDTATSVVPELETYYCLVVLFFLIYQREYNKAKLCSLDSVKRTKETQAKSEPKRTLDVLTSRLFFYFSYCHELSHDLGGIRRTLFELYDRARHRHDDLGKEMLLNLLLRNYLHYNLYAQAEKLSSKAPRFDAHTNNQLCRYLFYLGKIKTIHLEYTDAKEILLEADRIAPVAARGFRLQCNKWAILVHLLLGEIPERTMFVQKGIGQALRPYFELTNAMRIGNLEFFRNVGVKFGRTFSKDKTQNLIVRLRHNVIRIGLRNISISYSRISLADVAEKLRLNSETAVEDVESIIAKAIRDGAIDAKLDRANGWMLSKEPHDVYSTTEPQIAFHSRITSCLDMHNAAVRALRYPPGTVKDEESEEESRWRLWVQQLEEELDQAGEDDGAIELVAECRMGIVVKQKLSKVIEWVHKTGYTAIDNVEPCDRQKRRLSRNWKVQEPNKFRECPSLSEVLCLNTHCKAIFSASVGEIFLPITWRHIGESENENMFISRRLYTLADNKLAEDLICTGCRLCGSPLKQENGSTVGKNSVPLYCEKSSDRLHAVSLIYRPFMLYLWDESEHMPLLVKNNAAEKLFGNIKAERVHLWYKEYKHDKSLDPGCTQEKGPHDDERRTSKSPSNADDWSTDAHERPESVQNPQCNKNVNVFQIWLVVLKMLLRQGKNSPLKFEVTINASLDIENGRFEMVSVSTPCFKKYSISGMK